LVVLGLQRELENIFALLPDLMAADKLGMEVSPELHHM
jgi:hypothetical protein